MIEKGGDGNSTTAALCVSILFSNSLICPMMPMLPSSQPITNFLMLSRVSTLLDERRRLYNQY